MAWKAYEVPRDRMFGNWRDPLARYRKQRERRRIRNPDNSPEYRALIRRLPCMVVGCRTGAVIDPHHLKTGPAAAERCFNRRASDLHVLPLCRTHHEELESWPGACEPEWFWDRTAINCHAAVKALRAAFDPKDLDESFTSMHAAWLRLNLQAARDLYWRDPAVCAKAAREGR
jgi:hypothetical protein